MPDEGRRFLLFGASGAIGEAILDKSISKGWRVTAVSRRKPDSARKSANWVEADPVGAAMPAGVLGMHGPFHSVCWAQGVNATDSVYDVSVNNNLAVYKANCLYILITLKVLLDSQLLAPASRLCVISSIWQNLARQTKLSYCMSKAALQGLVLSAAADLAQDGHLINAVLPGALDTPMTRRNLNPEQLGRFTGATKFGKLPQLDDVASLVCYLCSEENSGITGQFIASDLGFSHVRLV